MQSQKTKILMYTYSPSTKKQKRQSNNITLPQAYKAFLKVKKMKIRGNADSSALKLKYHNEVNP